MYLPCLVPEAKSVWYSSMTPKAADICHGLTRTSRTAASMHSAAKMSMVPGSDIETEGKAGDEHVLPVVGERLLVNACERMMICEDENGAAPLRIVNTEAGQKLP